MMVFLRELPVPVKELDQAFIDIFFNFANTYTEESVLHSMLKRRKEADAAPSAEMFREMGYSEKDIAEMDI